MKKLILLPLTMGFGLSIAWFIEPESASNPDPSQIPVPTQVATNMEDEKAYEAKRDAWFDLIHGSQTNWKEINAENFRLAYEKKKSLNGTKTVESFANGLIQAEWKERGSTNQAGNVRISDYHAGSDAVYAISDGGMIWRGDLTGATWVTLNDDIQFGRRVIKVVDLPGGGIRILASIAHKIWYSDDDGLSWTEASGFMNGSGSGTGIDLVQLEDAAGTLVYLYNRVNVTSGAGQNRVAYSVDQGANWIYIGDLNSYSNRWASMGMAHGATTAYILDNNDDIYVFEGTGMTQITSGLSLSGNTICQIEVNMTAADTTIYILMQQEDLYKSTDGGLSFNFVSTLPIPTWSCGFGVSIDNPDRLYYGEMELWRSFNGGVSWDLVNDWWAYYGDVPNKIHADIMSISSFKTSGGTEFTLIPNHGGISVSFDNMITTQNIGMQDLNVGQFYDVITSPVNSSYIYGGTQDQGFQRTDMGAVSGTIPFEQAISGDYGQMQFSGNGQDIWIQYPGADFSLWEDANSFNGSSDWYDLDGSNMPNYDWIVPTGPAPLPSDNYILVGGGEINGGSGSYLIKLENLWGTINAEQFPFDFRASSGANISAIETSPYNSDKWYVVTENGKFFHSEDAGWNWTKTTPFTGPSGDWIYGADIFASRLSDSLVFLGGSYYGGSAVWMSQDGGESFDAIGTGLPNTMVHEMCMDPAEQFLFAATDAGPYVYVVAEDQWYDILGAEAPVQEYMSVEFIEATYTVRFSTWGRGIWDFNMQTVASTEDQVIEEGNGSFYPNPVSNNLLYVNVQTKGILHIYTIQGQLVLNTALSPGINTIGLYGIPAGTYLIGILDEKGKFIRDKLIVQ